jgi:hypothetical protein
VIITIIITTMKTIMVIIRIIILIVIKNKHDHKQNKIIRIITIMKL